MNPLKTSFKNELEKVRKFSSLVENRLSRLNERNTKINSLTIEELKDLNQLLQITDYILTKHQNKKDVHSMFKEFVDMITKSIESMSLLNDEISELVISAENSIQRIKSTQNDVSNNLLLQKNTPNHKLIPNPTNPT
jgi:hypothetical protein